jgi:hypothetical protein
MNASVAQWIEQWLPKPCVAGSNPARGTSKKPVISIDYWFFISTVIHTLYIM